MRNVSNASQSTCNNKFYACKKINVREEQVFDIILICNDDCDKIVCVLSFPEKKVFRKIPSVGLGVAVIIKCKIRHLHRTVHIPGREC